MSASSKKKLRKEQEAVQMTEKQLTAQREAKKLNLYTTAFVAVMAVLLVIAVTVGVTNTISNSGMREKNTVALTIGEETLSNAQLSYYYMDAVNSFYSNYGSYASMFGLDVTKPLDEQFVDADNTTTWADDFLNTAKENAKAVYTLSAAAEEAGYALPEEELTSIENSINTLSLYATMYGYADTDEYLKGFYGKGASTEGYLEYCKRNALAQSYQNFYADSLTYEDADLRAAEAENYNAYSSFDFSTYYLSTSKFLTGGTTADDGTTIYSDEEKAASVAAAEEAAKALTGKDINSIEKLDEAIAALEINADTTASSTRSENALFSSLSSLYADWVSAGSRKAGDVTYVANTSTSTGEDGTETTVTNGYYVVMFNGSTENLFPLANVRHILVSYEHDHEDGETHEETYTAEEKAAAKAEAEAVLAEFEANATEDNFAALANEKSADGDGTTGGLYENVYPGQMVTNFNDWCFDASRKSGDTGIVETEYGYHVMYYVGDSEQSYRDYMIENDLRSGDVESWYNGLLENVTMTDGDTKYITTDLVLSSGN